MVEHIALRVRFAITLPIPIVFHRQWQIVKRQLLITPESCWIPCTMNIIGEKEILDLVQCATLVPNHAGPPIVWQDFDVNGVV